MLYFNMYNICQHGLINYDSCFIICFIFFHHYLSIVIREWLPR